jgi:hypothetical protein
MSGDKNLKDEVKALKGSLEKLEQANIKLAVKLGWLEGIAAVLLVLLGGLALFYIDLYRKSIDVDQFRRDIDLNNRNIEQYRQFEAVRSDVYEVLIDIFQNKLGDAIDRISLFAPSKEDTKTIDKVNKMQEQLSKMNISSVKFNKLSMLTKALNQLVIEGKAQEASTQVGSQLLPSSDDDFVASRALLLQAAANFSDGLCHDPKNTLDLISQAFTHDSSVVAAFNLKGVCLAQQSENLIEANNWKESIEKIRASLRYNELAYYFKPSQWSRRRFLNNKVWNSMQFLKAAVRLSKVEDALKELKGYKDMEDFFDKSLENIDECYLLSNDLSKYLETESELHALQYIYYINKGDDKANAAKDLMIEKLKAAINNGLLKARNLSNLKEAKEYFNKDPLLTPLFDNPDHSLNQQIVFFINEWFANSQ